MFSSTATLNELSQAVKNGALTDAQKEKLTCSPETNTAGGNTNTTDGKKATNPKNTADPAATTTIPATYRQPICPWFTCCY